MCTVTIIPLGRRGARLACNRDESRKRVAALPPKERVFGDLRAIMPVDPVSDGTWIAVNDAGLAMTLLNVYAVPHESSGPAAAGLLSRGTIIPTLLTSSTVAEATSTARALDIEAYPPFRLVMLDATGVIGELQSDRRRLAMSAYALDSAPRMFTSSGLGDQLVEGPRCALFNQLFASNSDWGDRQDRFHRHRWPDRPEVSVLMSRPEARTVSHTAVEILPDSVSLAYFDDPDDGFVRSVTLKLRLHPIDA